MTEDNLIGIEIKFSGKFAVGHSGCSRELAKDKTADLFHKFLDNLPDYVYITSWDEPEVER